MDKKSKKSTLKNNNEEIRAELKKLILLAEKRELPINLIDLLRAAKQACRLH